MENEELFRILAGKYPLRPELKEALNKMIKREYFPKNQIILKPGQIANRCWFLERGSAMGYMYNEDKKVTLWFSKEGKLMIPVKSFFSQKPADIYIKLLEPSIISSMTYDQVQEIKRTFPDSVDYINSVIQKFHEEVENRNVDVTEIENLQVGANYPSGVYNVIVSQGENTQTVRVIKR